MKCTNECTNGFLVVSLSISYSVVLGKYTNGVSVFLTDLISD